MIGSRSIFASSGTIRPDSLTDFSLNAYSSVKSQRSCWSKVFRQRAHSAVVVADFFVNDEADVDAEGMARGAHSSLNDREEVGGMEKGFAAENGQNECG